MNDELTTVMTRLSEPPPPASLKATVMARIARDANVANAAPSVAAAPARRGRETLVWLSAVGGLALVICAVAYGWLEAGALPSAMSPRLGPTTLSLLPAGPAALVIGLGLLVYLAGLFGPLSTSGRKTPWFSRTSGNGPHT